MTTPKLRRKEEQELLPRIREIKKLANKLNIDLIELYTPGFFGDYATEEKVFGIICKNYR